jgi:hypothetical protein
MADDGADLSRDLEVLDAELKRLEAEYNMYFAGRLPRPPWETRTRVSALVKRLDRARPSNYGDRFRFTTLQARFAAFVDLWTAAFAPARKAGRGPFAKPRPAETEERATGRRIGSSALRGSRIRVAKATSCRTCIRT